MISWQAKLPTIFKGNRKIKTVRNAIQTNANFNTPLFISTELENIRKHSIWKANILPHFCNIERGAWNNAPIICEIQFSKLPNTAPTKQTVRKEYLNISGIFNCCHLTIDGEPVTFNIILQLGKQLWMSGLLYFEHHWRWKLKMRKIFVGNFFSITFFLYSINITSELKN